MKEYKLIQWYPALPKDWLDSSSPIFVVERDNDEYHLHPSLYGFSTSRVVAKEEVENNPYFWEELIPLYEITSFHNGDNKIMSVKRKKDGEIFAVGDMARSVGKQTFHRISSIEIKQKQLCRNTYDGIDRIWLNWEINAGGNWMEDSERIKEPLLTTIDKVEIYTGDSYYLVTADFKIAYCESFSEGDLSFNCFFEKEKAENWIIENKPCLSINDITLLFGSEFMFMPEIVNIVKTRL